MSILLNAKLSSIMMMMWFIVWDAYTVVYMYEVTMSRRKGDEKSLVNNVAIKKEWGINLSVAGEW